MQRAVKERIQPRHATEFDQSVPAADPPERRDRKRDAEEAKRPNAGFVGEIAERIGTERAGERGPSEPSGRSQRRQKRKGLEQKTNSAVPHGPQ